MNRSINCSFRVLSAVLIVAAPVARAQESIHELPAHRIAETIRKFQNARIPNMETPATLFALPDAKWHEGDVAILTPIVNNKWNLHWIRTSGSEIVAVDENSLESFLKTEQIDLNALAESGATSADEVLEFLAVDTVHVRMEDEFTEGQSLNVETEDGSMTMKTKVVRLTSDDGMTVIGRVLEATTVISTSNIQGLPETQDLGTIRYFHTTGYVEQESIATKYFDQLKLIKDDSCRDEDIEIPGLHRGQNDPDDMIFAYDTTDANDQTACGVASIRFSINGVRLTRYVEPTSDLTLADADAIAKEMALSDDMNIYELPRTTQTATASTACLIETAVTAAQQHVAHDPFAAGRVCVIEFSGDIAKILGRHLNRLSTCEGNRTVFTLAVLTAAVGCCAISGPFCILAGIVCGGVGFHLQRRHLNSCISGSTFEFNGDVLHAEATLNACCIREGGCGPG